MNRSLIGCVCHLHPLQSQYLHPKYHCCHLLQAHVWTLLTLLMSESESATTSRSTISSARKPKNHSLLSESLKRSVLKTSNVFLWLDFQKLSLSHRTQRRCKMAWGSSGSLILLLFTRFSWDCTEISVFGSSKVYRSQLDILRRFARSPAQTFSDAVPCEGLR